MVQGELYPGEGADLGEWEGAQEDTPLLATKQAEGEGRPKPKKALVGGTTALVVGACLLAMAHQHGPGSSERRRMLAAYDAARSEAVGEWIDHEMHFHEETLSPLPLMERLKRHYDEPGHDRHHHQGETYEPLGRGEDRRRGLQDDEDMLTDGNTEPLKIHIDYSNMIEGQAQQYSGCFQVGAWFKWGFPADASPPCQTASWENRRTYATWVESDQNSCPSGASDLYATDNLEGKMCNREFSSTGQDCWGVCLEEDIMSHERQAECEGATSADEAFCDHLCDDERIINTGPTWEIGDTCNDACRDSSACQCGDAAYCTMFEWAQKNINAVVAETERYFRARRRTGFVTLQRSQGIYNSIYVSKGIAPAEACARDAQLMYRLPVDDAYCSTGFDGDVIFFPMMAQYAPNVGGWGGDAGSDEYGRPIILVMGWSMATTPLARYRKQLIGAPRSTILHEIVHGLGFSVYKFRDRRISGGEISSMVETRRVPDDTEEVYFVTSERTLAVARDYFGCPTLDGLPLMGDNQLGSGSRGSHWETRIMNDEFMAYGDGATVSGMTIAMLEDLGFYKGVYNNLQCMTWGKNQGCGFVADRCASRQEFSPGRTGNLIVSRDQGCNRHWKSGSGVGWETGEWTLVDDLGGWNNGLKSTDGRSCSSTAANSIIARYCVASGCRRQWPNMVRADPPLADTNQKPLWACNMPSNGISFDGYQYVCGEDECECAAECQTTNPVDGTLWGDEPADCKQPRGDVAAAASRMQGGLFDNPLEDYPLIIALGMLIMALCFASAVAKCIRSAHFSCLVGTSIVIFVIFIIGSLAVLIMTVYAYFTFEELDAIVSKNAWSYLIGLATAVLAFAIYGTISVCLVAKEKGCCKGHKWAIGIFSFLLFLLICCQTLGTFVAMFWVKDSYSFSEGQYTTRGQMSENAADKTRTGLSFIDESLDKAIRDVEAVTCNTYKKCCYTIAMENSVPVAPADEQPDAASDGSTLLVEGASCDVISTDTGLCTPTVTDEVTGEVKVLNCVEDDGYDIKSRCVDVSLSQCDAVHAENNEALKLCEIADFGAGSICVGRTDVTVGVCRPTIVNADTSFTCVASHAGASVGAAADALNDPSNEKFCQLLSGNNRKGITPTGAVCYAMEKVGILEDLQPDGSGSLATCAADFCQTGVSGYESYVSAIFVWIHEQVVPIGIMTGLLGMLEFLQLCVCLGMLCTDQKQLRKGFDDVKETAKKDVRRVGNKMHRRKRHQAAPRQTTSIEPNLP